MTAVKRSTPRRKAGPARKAPRKRASSGAESGGPPADRDFRARIRMYRQGLGDCFLLSLRKSGGGFIHVLIDCGVLKGTEAPAETMTAVMEDIEKATKTGNGQSRLDLVIATHEHWDHLSGFHQARTVFDRMDVREVWMPWTENPKDALAKRLRQSRASLALLLQRALASPLGAAKGLDGVAGLLEFSALGAAPGQTTSAALDYLRKRGKAGDGLRYLSPGEGPFPVPSAEGVLAYVLGPPRDEDLLGRSEVTKKMKEEGIIFEAAFGASARRAGLSAAATALDAALSAALSQTTASDDRYHPFSSEHRIPSSSPYFADIKSYLDLTYNDSAQAWRRIDEDWLASLGQLALKLDNDTNNTSLVLAFELDGGGEVLLFPGDAQIGNWLSWSDVKFEKDGTPISVDAADLLGRTIFYKVGHHGSHNATIKSGGLELMQRDGLIAFVPVDKTTAAKQGRKDENGKPKGWQMPAKGVFKALQERCEGRVVLSDAQIDVSPEALAAGVRDTDLYVELAL